MNLCLRRFSFRQEGNDFLRLIQSVRMMSPGRAPDDPDRGSVPPQTGKQKLAVLLRRNDKIVRAVNQKHRDSGKSVCTVQRHARIVFRPEADHVKSVRFYRGDPKGTLAQESEFASRLEPDATGARYVLEHVTGDLQIAWAEED